MSAAEALRVARRAGIRIGIDGDMLTLEADAEPPRAALDLLARHKSGIIKLLRPSNGWRAADWQSFFEQRRRIAEAERGLPRTEAEARAFACCIAEWLNRNPVRSLPDRCHHCGRLQCADDPLLPFGAEGYGHVWLHSICWQPWFKSREAEAVAVLATMGVIGPGTDP